jgi:hypothetical protein
VKPVLPAIPAIPVIPATPDLPATVRQDLQVIREIPGLPEPARLV